VCTCVCNQCIMGVCMCVICMCMCMCIRTYVHRGCMVGVLRGLTAEVKPFPPLKGVGGCLGGVCVHVCVISVIWVCVCV
jgi:hypothetical protein